MNTDQLCTELDKARSKLAEAEFKRDRARRVADAYARLQRGCALAAVTGLLLLVLAGVLLGVDGTLMPVDSLLGVQVCCWVIGAIAAVAGTVEYVFLSAEDATYERDPTTADRWLSRREVQYNGDYLVSCCVDRVTRASFAYDQAVTNSFDVRTMGEA